ncbi:MAG: DUF2892 domain-containing protein [Candidatus Goldiibacteriota bacterium]
MKKNVGEKDKRIRMVSGAVMIAGGFLVSGWIAAALWVLGAVLIITGGMGFCGLYALLGINTCPVDKK